MVVSNPHDIASAFSRVRMLRENAAMKTTRILGTAAVFGSLHWAAKSAAAKLKNQPNTYQLEELLHLPPGLEAVITRPDGTMLRTTSAGSGPPVLFAHGYGMMSASFGVLAEHLVRDGRRVVTFDQRGHGGSTIGSEGVGSAQMAGDYAAVVEHYDLQDAVLVGHSMGGFLAIQFLLDYPQHGGRFRGLVLMAATAGDITDGAPQYKVEIPLLKTGVVKMLGKTDTYGTLMSATVTARRSPAVLEAFRTMFVAQDHASIVGAIEMAVGESNYARLGEVRIPTRVISGTSDYNAPARHAERLAEKIAGATLTWVDGAGHLLNWEAVDEVLKEIRSLPTRAY